LDDDPRTTSNIDPAQLGSSPKYKPDATVQTGQDREQVGRFCPLVVLDRTANAPVPEYSDTSGQYSYTGTPPAGGIAINNQILIDDLGSDPSYLPSPPSGTANGADWEPFWRYRFATRLFDFLTVQAPNDDYLANYPRHQSWQPQTDYTVGQIVQARFGANSQPNLYICQQAHLSQATLTAQELGYWKLLPRQAVANGSTAKAGASDDAKVMDAESAEPVHGLININTADWKVLSTLPLVVNPLTGVVDDTAVPGGRYPKGTTYRILNQELAKAIVYWRDTNADPYSVTNSQNAKGHPLIAHGPFKSIFELNQVVDLRPSSALNPLNGLFGFANAMGTIDMSFINMNDPNKFNWTNNPGLGDPGPAVGDLSTQQVIGTSSGGRITTLEPHGFVIGDTVGISSTGNPSNADGVYQVTNVTDAFTFKCSGGPSGTVLVQKAFDGVRGDVDEQYLVLSRISNLISTRSDSFTLYVLIQGWQDAGTNAPKLVVQKRAAYIIDRSRMPYEPVRKVLVPND